MLFLSFWVLLIRNWTAERYAIVENSLDMGANLIGAEVAWLDVVLNTKLRTRIVRILLFVVL